jgi:hypothetical protein
MRVRSCAFLQDRSNYTPWVNKYMLDEVNHVGPGRTLIQQLAERGVQAAQIDTVLFRYVTYWLSHQVQAQFVSLLHGLDVTVARFGVACIPSTPYKCLGNSIKGFEAIPATL